jgi:hypothetical protein|eukprot:scaffold5642_cov86-Skeletonema_marinoi.AAC.1
MLADPIASHCGDWGRYLFNPATSHTLFAAAPPIHTLCVTTSEDRKNFAQCFVSFAKGSSSQAVPPSLHTCVSVSAGGCYVCDP